MSLALPSTDLYAAGHALACLSKSSSTHPITYALAGRLQLSDGWLVLTIPANLIRGAFDALHEPGAVLPDRFYIPVVSPQELDRLGGADKVSERGHQFHYSLGPLVSHEPGNGVARVVSIRILSPALKTLRVSYGLEPYPKGSFFSCPVAIRRTGVLRHNEVSKLAACHQEPDPEEFDLEKVAESVQQHIPLPSVPQQTPYTCGPASLKSILDYYGAAPGSTEDALATELKATPEAGTPPSPIIEAARRYGLKTQVHHPMTDDQLRGHLNQGRPVLVNLQAWGDPEGYRDAAHGHYAVAVGHDDQHVYFQDPNLAGKRDKITWQELNERWHDEEADGSKTNRFGAALWGSTPAKSEKIKAIEKMAAQLRLAREPHVS